MPALTSSAILTWAIAAAAAAGVVLRPFGWPEAIWAVVGAALLVVLGLLDVGAAVAGVARGTDVYLFLTGMMLLSEVARATGLFDYLAAQAVRRARGSPARLFLLIYVVGALVTVFLSNDATAVVLTPAVAAAVKAARAERPLPYLFICAFIANAASFVLPISNPANLVLYADQLPPLFQWLPRFALPSAVATVVTYGALRWATRKDLRGSGIKEAAIPVLSKGARGAACGIALTAVLLLVCSSFDLRLGLATCLAGAMTTAFSIIVERKTPWAILRGVSWSILPLVAGLFVLVEGLDRTGVTQLLSEAMKGLILQSADKAAWACGLSLGFVTNAMNNLAAGLIAGKVVQAGYAPAAVRTAALIGVDLGPNLSVTGSLATILWLNALRRDGHQVSAWAFLKIGILAMPPALVLAIGSSLLFR